MPQPSPFLQWLHHVPTGLLSSSTPSNLQHSVHKSHIPGSFILRNIVYQHACKNAFTLLAPIDLDAWLSWTHDADTFAFQALHIKHFRNIERLRWLIHRKLRATATAAPHPC